MWACFEAPSRLDRDRQHFAPGSSARLQSLSEVLPLDQLGRHEHKAAVQAAIEETGDISMIESLQRQHFGCELLGELRRLAR